MRAAPPRSPGVAVRARYRILDILREEPLPRRYLAEDVADRAERWALTEHPLPVEAPPWIWARVQESLHDVRTQISWLRDPRIVMPRECFTDGDSVFSATPLVDGIPLDHHLRATSPSIYQILLLFRDACDIVRALHDAGIFLRRLAFANLVVTSSGTLTLQGLELDEHFRLSLATVRDESWTPGDDADGAVADVWCLGELLRRLLAAFQGTLKASFTAPRALFEVVTTATDADSERRYSSVSSLKAEVELLLWQRAHGPEWPETPTRVRLARGGRLRRAVKGLLRSLLQASVLMTLAWSCGEGDRAWRQFSSHFDVASPGDAWTRPSGSLLWVEGSVRAPSQPLLGPYSGRACVGYDATVAYGLQRETWSSRARAYATEVYQRVANEERRWLRFTLEGGPSRLAVVPEEARVQGRDEVEAWSSADAVSPPRWSLEGAALLTVQPGERVLGVRRREARVLAGERVCVWGVLDRDSGGAPVLRGRLVFKGEKAQLAAAAICAILPFALALVASLAASLAMLWTDRRAQARQKLGRLPCPPS